MLEAKKNTRGEAGKDARAADEADERSNPLVIEYEELQVLARLTEWVRAGRMSWLCTVVSTWGSSPRSVGSLLCCNDRGEVAGSLSGGCVEDDLLERLQAGELGRDKPQLLVYGATQEEVERFQLPCGGQLHIVIEPFADAERADALGHVVARLEARQCVERSLDVASGDFTIADADRFRHLRFDGGIDADGLDTKGKKLTQVLGPKFQLFLIGAGQVSQYLARMALLLDYHVIVCDPRSELIDQWPVAGAQLVCGMPDDAVKAHAMDPSTAIVALTHDPRIDDMGLMEALKTDACFVGAMGSARTSAKRRERLKLLDLTDGEIDRLHGPVGLPIGSKTPAEIAVAILAQLTSIRAAAKVDSGAVDSRV